mgnify:CR=1 FL=1
MNRAVFSAPLRDGVVPVDMLPDGGQYPFRARMDQWYLWPGCREVPPVVVPLPEGYRTDGPSIPWFAQGVVKKDGPAWPAALFHDVACSAELWPARICNLMMSDAMHDWGTVPVDDQDKIELAIGLFCWITFRSHKIQEVVADRDMVVSASRRIWRQHGPEFAGYARIEDVLLPV